MRWTASTDLTPVVGAMEQIRTVYKNAMHVTRKTIRTTTTEHAAVVERAKLGDKELFEAFCNEMNGNPPSEMMVSIFEEVLQELLKEDREQVEVSVK